MQTYFAHGDPKLDFYCKDPQSKTAADCASFYRTDRRTWVVQGDALGDGVASQLRGLKEDETFLEIPERLVEHFVHRYAKEKYGVDLAGAARGTDQSGP